MKELINALKVIQEECHSHNSCSVCPMRDDSGKCGIYRNTPVEWDIIEEQTIRVIRSKNNDSNGN